MLNVVMLNIVLPLRLRLLRFVPIGKVCVQKRHQYRNMILPSLLGLVNRNDPICVTPPKVAEACSVATFACYCDWRYCAKTSPMETRLYTKVLLIIQVY